MNLWPEYQEIAKFYGDQVAKRSGVRLMNHIDEGLALLRERGATELAMRAFCLHPLVQNSEAIDVSWSDAYPLACEYRDKANAYLCRPETDHITLVEQLDEVVGEVSADCQAMLVADKMQNRKDFYQYHWGTHPRSMQLAHYFDLWLKFLNVCPTCAGDCGQCGGTGR